MKKLLTFFVMIFCCLSIVFAPFWFLRGEVKSSYDMIHVIGDNNEAVVTGTAIYYFSIDHVMQAETIVISRTQTPTTHFFLISYLLPLKYKMGEERVIITDIPTGAQLADIYDNGMYTASFYYSYGFGSLVINQSARAR